MCVGMCGRVCVVHMHLRHFEHTFTIIGSIVQTLIALEVEAQT